MAQCVRNVGGPESPRLGSRVPNSLNAKYLDIVIRQGFRRFGKVHSSWCGLVPFSQETEDDRLFNQKTVGSKFSYYNVDTITAFDTKAIVRERHPVDFACFRRAALAQLPYLFQRRYNQLYSRLRVDQRRLELLIVERPRLLGVWHAPAESKHLTRFHPLIITTVTNAAVRATRARPGTLKTRLSDPDNCSAVASLLATCWCARTTACCYPCYDRTYSTTRPSARNCPMTTATWSPGFTCLPLLEKAIQ